MMMSSSVTCDLPMIALDQGRHCYRLIRGKKSADPMLAAVIKLSPVANKKIVINEARNCSLSFCVRIKKS